MLRHRSSGIGGTYWASKERQAGFTLLEALVTLVILSVALMGLAFLQAQGLQFNTSAYARTQASILASDIIDRMRLNPLDVASYDTSTFTPDPSSCTVTAAPEVNNDRDCWYQRLQEALPGGDGDIRFDGASGVVTVTIRWQERPAGRRDDNFDPSTLTRTDLDNLQVHRVSMSAVI